MILILGGGLAGLSAAYHAHQSGQSYRLFEREQEPGGLCRSHLQDGFMFDWTGHLLHFRKPEIKAWIQDLMGPGLKEIERRAYLVYQDQVIPYPFQANTHALPEQARQQCVDGFKQAHIAAKQLSPASSFKDWVLSNFGEGFAEHFFFPFNQKMWKRDLADMTCEWVWSIPIPSIEDIERGAQAPTDKKFGYNPVFYYPSSGGIGSMARHIADQLPAIDYASNVTSVNVKQRYVTLTGGEKINYDHLISTIPVRDLLQHAQGIDADVKDHAQQLNYISVFNLNIGFEGHNHLLGQDLKPQWVYFPEKKYPFYRVGCYHHILPSMAPEGCGSLYVECSFRPEEGIPDQEQLLEQCVQGLIEVGLLPAKEAIKVVDKRILKYAYVVFDKHRSDFLPQALSLLEQHNIYSVGRYGSWDYLSMEDAIYQGQQAVHRIGA